VRKLNGEEISIQLEPDEMVTVADWLDAASEHVSGGKAKAKRKRKTP